MNTPAGSRCLRVATLSLLLGVAIPAAAQEEGQPTEASEPVSPPRRLFVSDKLVLNVYSEPEQGGSRVATIETGDAVDELERSEGFIRIRLSDGLEGWVGSNYLTTDAPAAVQLRELQRQQKSSSQADKKAAEEIARLKKESESLQTQLKEANAAATAAAAPAPDDGVLEGASPAPRQLAAAAPASSGGSIWLWLLIVAAAAGISYAAGYQSLARRIRKKFGGLRIY